MLSRTFVSSKAKVQQPKPTSADAQGDKINLKVISYNVDGLNERQVLERAIFSAHFIAEENPDVICLQEVVFATKQIFIKYFTSLGYVHSSGESSTHYFTLTFVRNTFTVREMFARDFTGEGLSSMGRNMNILVIALNAINFLIINTHLESCKENSFTRKSQFKAILQKLIDFDGPALLCGDLNIRDDEVKFVQKALGISLGKDIIDAWIVNGRNKEDETTWTLYNDPNIMSKIYRFDRMLYNNKNSLQSKSFRLIGKALLPPPISSPASDHFGMSSLFEIVVPEGQSISTSNVAFTSPTKAVSTNNWTSHLPSSTATLPTSTTIIQHQLLSNTSHTNDQTSSARIPLSINELRNLRLAIFDKKPQNITSVQTINDDNPSSIYPNRKEIVIKVPITTAAICNTKVDQEIIDISDDSVSSSPISATALPSKLFSSSSSSTSSTSTSTSTPAVTLTKRSREVAHLWSDNNVICLDNESSDDTSRDYTSSHSNKKLSKHLGNEDDI